LNENAHGLENAAQFEQMAADEKDPKLKAEFKRKAASYRERAKKRAKKYGLGEYR